MSNYRLALSVLGFLGLCSTTAPASEMKVLDGTMEEYPLPVTLESMIVSHLWHGMDLYLVDASHRIAVVSGKSSVWVGGVGNRKGDFYYIEGLAVGPDGILYVRDAGNKRIQVSDTKRAFVSEFADFPKSLGFAVSGRNVLLGQPALGSLVTSYDSTGKRLASFGTLSSASEIYGSKYMGQDRKLKLPMNRIWITTDDDGNIWCATLHAPMLMKFSPRGVQLLRKELNVPDLEPLKKAVFEYPPPSRYASINFDGIQVTFVIKDLVYDRSRKELLILLGDKRIIAVGLDGKERYAIKLRAFMPSNISVDAGGQIFASNFISTKLYRVNVPGR